MRYATALVMMGACALSACVGQPYGPPVMMAQDYGNPGYYQPGYPPPGYAPPAGDYSQDGQPPGYPPPEDPAYAYQSPDGSWPGYDAPYQVPVYPDAGYEAHGYAPGYQPWPRGGADNWRRGYEPMRQQPQYGQQQPPHYEGPRQQPHFEGPRPPPPQFQHRQDSDPGRQAQQRGWQGH